MVKTVVAYICAIALLLLAVFVFTRPALLDVYNLKDQGTLGDAINGLTAPIIGLITAGLLFYSFKAQIEANNLLRSQNHFDTYTKLFKQLEEGVNSFHYEFTWHTTIPPTSVMKYATKLPNGNHI